MQGDIPDIFKLEIWYVHAPHVETQDLQHL
jgi:hypothetical protein